MVKDFYTKPLQVAFFRKIRSAIMGVTQLNYLIIKEPTPVKERVGKNGFTTAISNNGKNLYETSESVKLPPYQTHREVAKPLPLISNITRNLKSHFCNIVPS